MKKNTLQVIIIVLLVILITMMFGFGVYYVAREKVEGGPEISDSDSNSSDNTTITENTDVDNSNVKKELSDDERNIIISNIKELRQINTMKDFNVETASDDEIINIMMETEGGRLPKKIQDTIQKHLYTNRVVDGTKVENILCDGTDNQPWYQYDKETDTVSIAGNHPHGGRCHFSIEAVKIVDSEINNDTYIIKVNNLFSNAICGEGVVNRYYTQYYNDVDPFYASDEDDMSAGINKFYNSTISDIYTYTFKKVGNDFKLVSYSYNK